MEDRKLTLLLAAHTLLMKQKNAGHVLDILSETVHYDGADCDGNCLLEDITIELEIDD